MSTSFSGYLGAYVVAKFAVAERPERIKACANKSCGGYAKERGSEFCPHCGSKITSVEIKVKTHVNHFDIDLNEVLCVVHEDKAKNLHLWISNKTDNARRFDWTNEDAISINDLSSVNPRQEITEFEDAYASQLNMLRRHYDKIEICWGLVSYTS